MPSAFHSELGGLIPEFVSTLTFMVAFRIASVINQQQDNIWIEVFKVAAMLYVITCVLQFVVTLEERMEARANVTPPEKPSLAVLTLMWVKCARFMITTAQTILARLMAVLMSTVVALLPPEGASDSDPLRQDFPVAIVYLGVAYLAAYVMGVNL